jgi:GNAT superfamily N-acetyltransferase
VTGDAEDIDVRAIGEEDLPAVARLWLEMRLEEAGNIHNPEATASDLGSIYRLAARRFREAARILLIAYRGGQAVGFYSGRIRGHVGGGLDLYVTSWARRRGVGRRLVEAALTCYRERGADRIVGALRGSQASHQFWATIWREHPSPLLRTREAAGIEWRTRSLAPIETDPDSGPQMGQGQPAGQSNSK